MGFPLFTNLGVRAIENSFEEVVVSTFVMTLNVCKRRSTRRQAHQKITGSNYLCDISTKLRQASYFHGSGMVFWDALRRGDKQTRGEITVKPASGLVNATVRVEVNVADSGDYSHLPKMLPSVVAYEKKNASPSLPVVRINDFHVFAFCFLHIFLRRQTLTLYPSGDDRVTSRRVHGDREFAVVLRHVHSVLFKAGRSGVQNCHTTEFLSRQLVIVPSGETADLCDECPSL